MYGSIMFLLEIWRKCDTAVKLWFGLVCKDKFQLAFLFSSHCEFGYIFPESLRHYYTCCMLTSSILFLRFDHHTTKCTKWLNKQNSLPERVIQGPQQLTKHCCSPKLDSVNQQFSATAISGHFPHFFDEVRLIPCNFQVFLDKLALLA